MWIGWLVVGWLASSGWLVFGFLDAPTHLYKEALSVGRSVCLSVRWSVGLLVGHAFVKTAKKRRIH